MAIVATIGSTSQGRNQVTVKAGASKQEAEEAKKQLEEAGATVELS